MISLTATDLPRFIQCNGFTQMNGVENLETDNTVREEGNAAHWLVEQVFKGEFSSDELIDRKAPNGIFITGDMADYCQEYIDHIIGKGDIETNTSYKGQCWEIRGRADHVAVEGTQLFVDDFKYGWRPVEVEKNWTLLSHAIGWLSTNTDSVQVDEIIFRIFQPRPFHPNGTVRTWTLPKQELWDVYWKLLQVTLENPRNTLETGESCYKCKSRTNCPAAQICAMNAIDVSNQIFNSHLEGEKLTYVYEQLQKAQDVIKQNIDAYSDLITAKLKKGEKVPNYAVQTSLGSLQWRDNITPELMQIMTGRDDLSKQTLITPTQAKSKGVPEEVIKGMSERKSRGVKLVRVNETENAQNLFGKK